MFSPDKLHGNDWLVSSKLTSFLGGICLRDSHRICLIPQFVPNSMQSISNPSSSPLVTASSFANQKGHQIFVSLNPKYPVSEVHRAFLAETKRQDSLNEIRWKSGISIIYVCTWCQIPNSKSMVFFLVTPPKKNYMRWLNDLLNLRNLIEQYQTYAPVVKLNLDHLPQGYQGKRYHQEKLFQQKQPPQEIQ